MRHPHLPYYYQDIDPYRDRPMRDTFKTQRLDHWQNGGTGVTKFSAEELPTYEQAVAEYGDTTVFLKGLELHRQPDRDKDLGEFWKVFYRIRKDQAS